MSEHLESQIVERKNRLSLMSFDDILIRMEKTAYESLDFRNRVRSLYQAVLVDEFQDTDTIQYRIFKRLFIESEKEGGPACFAVFVGDPKQSIYGFRGADIGTYLKARDEASAVLPPYTLSTNYRTTPAEVAAVNTLFTDPAGNSRFPGGIGYSPVKSTANHFPLFVRERGKVKPLPAFELWSGRWVEGPETSEVWPRCGSAAAMRETDGSLIAMSGTVSRIRRGRSPNPGSGRATSRFSLRTIKTRTRSNRNSRLSGSGHCIRNRKMFSGRMKRTKSLPCSAPPRIRRAAPR